jgi:4-hydroxybenzoate polyprenyltransferase
MCGQIFINKIVSIFSINILSQYIDGFIDRVWPALHWFSLVCGTLAISFLNRYTDRERETERQRQREREIERERENE